MSLFGTLNTGASGLGASSLNLSVIGDNIANIGTVGFKGSRAEFADMMPDHMQGLGGVFSIGTGATLGHISTSFSQGSLQNTGSALDVALLGKGFFQVSDGGQDFYTRDGSFNLDADGFVVNGAGMRVQGYTAVQGTITPTVGDLHVESTGVPSRMTTEITLDAILSSATPQNIDWAALPPIDGTIGAPTFDELGGASDFSTSVRVYDSVGMPHDVSVFFQRGAGDDWTYSAVIDAGEIDPAVTPGAEPDHGLEIATGTLSFDPANGNLLASTGPTPTATAWQWNGAAPWTFALDMGGATGPDGSIRQDSTSSFVNTISQDGRALGSLASLRVQPDGKLIGAYTNGEERALGQLSVATFTAEGGLERMGGNMFRETAGSGAPALGAPGTSDRGSVSGFALEGSNVELEDEFVAMIRAQRSYQANTGVIKAVDETLQELVNLV